MLIDSHIHLDNDRFAEDRRAVLERANAAGVGLMLCIGIGEQAREMHRGLDVCREFNGPGGERTVGLPRLLASAGVYPHNTAEMDAKLLIQLDALLAEPEVIACGEIGLDYYHDGASKAVQHAGLIAQLEIAAARKRPILIHCRPEDDAPSANPAAWEDLFAILEGHWGQTGLGGVMHCFSGDQRQAERSLEMGFLLSFAGNLTFPRAEGLRSVAAGLAPDSVLVETDAPWLAPVPERGKRNESSLMVHTAHVLAELMGLSDAEIADRTTKNFLRLFGLKSDVGN